MRLPFDETDNGTATLRFAEALPRGGSSSIPLLARLRYDTVHWNNSNDLTSLEIRPQQALWEFDQPDMAASVVGGLKCQPMAPLRLDFPASTVLGMEPTVCAEASGWAVADLSAVSESDSPTSAESFRSSLAVLVIAFSHQVKAVWDALLSPACMSMAKATLAAFQSRSAEIGPSKPPSTSFQDGAGGGEPPRTSSPASYRA